MSLKIFEDLVQGRHGNNRKNLHDFDGEPRGVPREVYMGDGSWVSFL